MDWLIGACVRVMLPMCGGLQQLANELNEVVLPGPTSVR
jgi:hypothetical protein